MTRALTLLLVLCGAPAAQGVANGDFERVEQGQPAGWFRSRWAGRGTQTLAEGEGRAGSRCVRIESQDGADIAWSCRARVLSFSTYRLSGWIRTTGVSAGSGKGALLNVHGRGPEHATEPVTGDSDWREVTLVLETGSDDEMMLNCLFGGWGRSTGTAFFDDVTLTLVQKGAAPEPRVRIDADAVQTPISPYIYGQFIEHLGRCIQGGIWAELLPDRKFFHAVDSADSPWHALGSAQVTMDSSAPFVGAHSPRLSLGGGGSPAGLRHARLPLTEGKEYVGRVWYAGDASIGAVALALVWGDGEAARASAALPAPATDWRRHEFRLRAGITTDDGELRLSATGSGTLRVGCLSLLPADHVGGLRADTLAALRELDAPVYRWPGGNFVSGYDWRDGVGDPDRRPSRKNPAWQGIESNDMGIAEFVAFCRVLGTEPYVAVNAGSGEAEAAAALVEYCNGGAGTPLGALRAQHGHAAPFAIRCWGIGNEMWGDWQIGHMPIARFAAKHNRFATAMRAVDPTITLVACGLVGNWDEGLFTHCAGALDHVSEHVYTQERAGLHAHVMLMPQALRRFADAWRGYRLRFPFLAERNVRIAMDEWNYWYGPHVFGELGTRYFLKDALGIAAGLHEFFRGSDVFWMANYAQTVNVIGCVKTSPRRVALETTGLVLKLYRRRFGTVPVAVECEGLLDASAAWTPDRRALTLGIVNPTRQPVRLPVAITGVKLRGGGTRYEIAGDDPMAFNDPELGQPVTIVERPLPAFAGTLDLAPCSVTLFVLPADH